MRSLRLQPSKQFFRHYEHYSNMYYDLTLTCHGESRRDVAISFIHSFQALATRLSRPSGLLRPSRPFISLILACFFRFNFILIFLAFPDSLDYLDHLDYPDQPDWSGWL